MKTVKDLMLELQSKREAFDKIAAEMDRSLREAARDRSAANPAQFLKHFIEGARIILQTCDNTIAFLELLQGTAEGSSKADSILDGFRKLRRDLVKALASTEQIQTRIQRGAH